MMAMAHLLFVSGRAIADDAESIHEVIVLPNACLFMSCWAGGRVSCLGVASPIARSGPRPLPHVLVPGAGEVRQELCMERVETSPRNDVT